MKEADCIHIQNVAAVVGYQHGGVMRRVVACVCVAAFARGVLVRAGDCPGIALEFGMGSAGSHGSAIAAACGENVSLCVRPNGTVDGWGQNDCGQCSPPSGLDSCSAVSAGPKYALALL